VADRVLFVFSKEPRPGDVKTRLCPPLSAAQAARCHAGFIGDVLARMNGAASARTVLVAAPAGDAPFLARTAQELGVELAWQKDGHLGRRLDAVLNGAAGLGTSAAVIGTDSPDLPVEIVQAAFEEAEDCRGVALGPSDDGGFYLLACCAGVSLPLAALDPPWGSAHVLESTIGSVRNAGHPVRLMPWWYDVDDAAGLARLALRIRVARAAGRDPGLPRCERLLLELAKEGIAI
jgi:rSAM/selenodomain-associated transferase 1